jgi:hypothetical protein
MNVHLSDFVNPSLVQNLRFVNVFQATRRDHPKLSNTLAISTTESEHGHHID